MTKKAYFITLSIIILIAAALRFWNIGGLQQLVFDEVFFPKYGHNYLTSTYYFDVHPPLSKYLIGVGIWLYNIMPWVSDPAYNTVNIEQLNAVSWRWMNAVIGTAVCFVGARLSLYLHPSRLLSLLIAAFLATDGTLLIESRFGLNNIYIVFFGLCAVLFLARAYHGNTHRKSLILCGVFLGLSLSVKWNGLGYSLLAWTILIAPPLLLLISRLFKQKPAVDFEHHSKNTLLSSIPLWELGLYLFVIPFVVYFIVWQPHLMMFDKHNFIEMQKQILGFHSNSATDDHPYCSKWYQWPLQIRPMGYYFTTFTNNEDSTKQIFIDQHFLGNPILFWFSFAAVIALAINLKIKCISWYKTKDIPEGLLFQSVVVIGFFGNWLPWVIVSRCTFQYLYMPASVFSFMATAWYIYKGFNAKSLWIRRITWVAIACIVCGFLYWLPVQIGIPISRDGFYSRMWLNSWI